MSQNMMEEILQEMNITELDRDDTEELHEDIKNKFGIIGSFEDLNCEALETIWGNRKEEITKFIKIWVKQKVEKKRARKKLLVVA